MRFFCLLILCMIRFCFSIYIFCSRTNHDNGCYKKGPYCSPCSGFDNDNDTDNRNISTYTLWYVDVWTVFCGAPGQDMTVLDSRLYTWQEDLRWFGWFGVYWTDMNRMNCSAFRILYSGLFRYSECMTNGVFSRNSQTSITDPSIFLAHYYEIVVHEGMTSRSWNHNTTYFHQICGESIWVPFDESWGWHELQMHLRRSLRLAWCLMYVPRPSVWVSKFSPFRSVFGG